MKRINLLPREPFFPLPISLQKKIVYPLILLILVYYSFNFYKYKKELDSVILNVSNLKMEIESMRKSITEKSVYLEKSNVIENEFLTIKEDYYLLKKNMLIKDIFERLTVVVPPNLWVTSISYSDNPENTINVTGKSFDKNEIFIFLNNCLNIGKNAELIGIDKESNNVYNFNIKIDGI